MVAYRLVIKKKALEFVRALPPISQRLVVEMCKTLAIEPFPGKGDKEIVMRKNHQDIYRLNISRSYTAFYKINKDEQRVLIQEIATIEQAHKIYGRF